ncbi:MAG: pyridoxamine 5'-phosphate oxidase [Bacteroidetes bacterium HGW-Bacteroidetes-6]|jgi:pyridoxamine 5'-phosphate oxidase|nr:MAG: pyridoxamine 5'-phosphate oxidase [Bacteroidetes bacterium HGW-Bacteroidetes-6]
MDNLQKLRREYSGKPILDNHGFENPIEFFEQWLTEAINSDCMEPNAMNVATAGIDAKPHSRIVLLKGVEEDTFVFFTHYNSNKGLQLAENPNAALLFYWPELFRQVRIEGSIAKLGTEASENYFKSRPLESRISAVVSPQSKPIPSRKWLEQQWEAIKKSKTEPSRPEEWGGYFLQPESIEFWQGRPNRLHDRILFSKTGKSWTINRLAP